MQLSFISGFPRKILLVLILIFNVHVLSAHEPMIRFGQEGNVSDAGQTALSSQRFLFLSRD